MKTIVVATGNPHKVEELRAVLDLPGVRLITLADAPGGEGGFPEPAETGRTFEENATIKALAYARATGMACLADDSGLEVDALGGRPGVISSHYATDGRETGATRAERDEANNRRVLAELEGVPPERRGARFVCVMVLAEPGENGVGEPRVVARARGTFEGRIGCSGDVPRGTHGFGYDPLFLVGPAFLRTSAEFSPGEKNAISHRAAAARELRRALAAR